MGLTKNKVIIGFPIDPKYAQRLDRKTIKALRVYYTEGHYSNEVFIVNDLPTNVPMLVDCQTVDGDRIFLNTAWIVKAVPVIYDLFRFDVSNDSHIVNRLGPNRNQIVVEEFACVYKENTEVEIIDKYLYDCKEGSASVVSRKNYCLNKTDIK